MAVKPPRGGNIHVDVDVHINSNKRPDLESPRQDIQGNKGFDSWVFVDNPTQRAKPSGDTDLDAILPAPTVTVHPAPLASELRPVAQPPLDSYRVDTTVELPPADREGFRRYKQRQYVDMSDGGIVLVGLDPDTGLYRARRSSELLPSGPILLRDPDSGLWHPLNDSEATLSLTEASLTAFRTGLDFSSAEAGSDGLFRHDGKLYVVIHEQAYQAMQDLDASSPAHKVWRIVNPKDPVASDSANIYRASRSGETRAITRNEENTWVSILTGLRGGMRRNEPAPAGASNLHRPWLTSTAGPSGVPSLGAAATTRAQVKRYFPEATDQHADDFIARFTDTDTAEAELKRLKLEFPQLDRELTAWEAAYKGKNSDEVQRRLAIGAKIRRLYKWQAEPWEKVYRDGRLTGLKLYMDMGRWVYQKPPVFSPRLDSVVALSLSGGVVQHLGEISRTFSHVESLEVAMHGLKGFPVGIEGFTQLRSLDLSRCLFTLPSADVGRFAHLTGLQELNLEGNWQLSLAPSVRGMTELRVLNLRYTGISALPDGLGEVSGPSRLQVLDLQWNRGLQVAPDVSRMSELRVLDLTDTGIHRLPAGLGSETGPLRLEVLNLGSNPLFAPPSLRGMPALQEVNLSNTRIDRFPEGITSAIPQKTLNLAANRILTIPESLELRKGFDLSDNPITDPASLRRLIFARRQTGTDIWLGRGSVDLSANLWLHHVPPALIPDKLALWDRLASFPESNMMWRIRELSRTPEFQIERLLLQRRVWRFLEHFDAADPVEQARLRAVTAISDMSRNDPPIGLMLDRLDEEIQAFDHTRQNQPPHHLTKRPALD